MLDNKNIRRAISIAKRDLRNCYLDNGVIGGLDHFDDYWARDSFFASWGSLAIGDIDIVRKNLELFINFQRADGLIPRRVDRYYFMRFKYLTGIKILRKNLKPVYYGRNFYPNIDPNPLFILTAEKYIKKTNDLKWLNKYFDNIINASYWLKKQDKDVDGLIDEGSFADWMDVIHKEGTVFYSNILTYAAFEAVIKLASLLGKPQDNILLKWQERLQSRLQKVFWNGQYFSDFLQKGKHFDFLSTDGNLLAIIYGLADVKQIKKIFNSMDNFFGKSLPATNFPPYPWRRLALRHIILGLWGYQNAYARWSWLAALSIAARFVGGDKNSAIKELDILSEWILRHGAVFEIYKPDGNPYSGLFWKSEKPFPWGAGMFLWAASIIGVDLTT